MTRHLGRRGVWLALVLAGCGGSTGSHRDDEGPLQAAGAGAAVAGAGSAGIPRGLAGEGVAPGDGGAAGHGGQASATGGITSLPTLVDCCATGLSCDATSAPTCEPVGGKRWQCSCGNGPNERIFQTDEPTSQEACALAGSICGLADLTLGDEACSEGTSSSTMLDCQAQVACERRISTSFAPGANAWLVQETAAACHRLLSGDVYECACADETQTYRVSALSAASVCQPFLSFCLASPRPAIDGPPACSSLDSAMTEVFCRNLEACGRSLELASGVRVLEEAKVHEWQCLPGSPTPECTCVTPDTVLTFEALGLSSSVPTSDVCGAAAAACRGEASVMVTGAPSCQATRVATTTNGCVLESSCAVPARLQALDVSVEGKLAVECARSSVEEPWKCGCASNRETAMLELGASAASSADACASAVPRCVELVGVSVEPYDR